MSPLANENKNENDRPERARAHRWFTGLCWIQGLYYLVTGIWPIVSIRTFQAVTGPKTDHLPTGREADHWLVMTVAVLILAIALTLLLAALRQTKTAEVMVLAVASATGLLVIDVIYVYRGVIAPIYLADAALEVLLLTGWGAVLIMGSIKGERAFPSGESGLHNLGRQGHTGI